MKKCPRCCHSNHPGYVPNGDKPHKRCPVCRGIGLVTEIQILGWELS